MNNKIVLDFIKLCNGYGKNAQQNSNFIINLHIFNI
jgi:hypothetical protein